MAPGHWQIVKYRADGSSREGGFRTFDLDQAPQALIDIAIARRKTRVNALKARGAPDRRRLLRRRRQGDRQRLHRHGGQRQPQPRARDPISVLPEIGTSSAHVGYSRHAMDQVGKDEIWTRVLKWFVVRFEQ
jgi:hypothetical protein